MVVWCAVTTPVFGGNTLVTTTFTGDGPFLAAFRPKSFAAEPAVSPAAGELVDAPVPDLGGVGGARVVASHVEESSGPKLDEAAVVVSGGRGLGEASKFELVEQLARLLQGAAGASRAIGRCRLGAVSACRSVRPARCVKPNVYIACGISGATQHMVGMKGSKTHHRHQQGRRGADLRDRRSGDRRRRPQGPPQTDRNPPEPLTQAGAGASKRPMFAGSKNSGAVFNPVIRLTNWSIAGALPSIAASSCCNSGGGGSSVAICVVNS